MRCSEIDFGGIAHVKVGAITVQKIYRSLAWWEFFPEHLASTSVALHDTIWRIAEITLFSYPQTPLLIVHPLVTFLLPISAFSFVLWMLLQTIDGCMGIDFSKKAEKYESTYYKRPIFGLKKIEKKNRIFFCWIYSIWKLLSFCKYFYIRTHFLDFLH